MLNVEKFNEWLKDEGKKDSKLTRLEWAARCGNKEAFDIFADVIAGKKSIDNVCMWLLELNQENAFMVHNMFVLFMELLSCEEKHIDLLKRAEKEMPDKEFMNAVGNAFDFALPELRHALLKYAAGINVELGDFKLELEKEKEEGSKYDK